MTLPPPAAVNSARPGASARAVRRGTPLRARAVQSREAYPWLPVPDQPATVAKSEGSSMARTIAAVFGSRANAEGALQALVSAGLAGFQSAILACSEPRPSELAP